MWLRGLGRCVVPMPETFVELAARVRNWGRWGERDERGTLNLLTPERVVHAASLVRTGDDRVTMGLQAATHGDALAHGSYEGRLYNGFPASSVTEHGAAHCGIE